MEKKRNLLGWICYGLEKFGSGICAVGAFFKKHWRLGLEFRKVIMAAPVVLLMLSMAAKCRQTLPEMVGINLLQNGDFAQMIAREAAISGCMAVTVICLVFMFLSRKTVYPWLISLFSLLLPVILIITNTFPA